MALPLPRGFIIIQTCFSALSWLPFNQSEQLPFPGGRQDHLEGEEQGLLKLDLCSSLWAVSAKVLNFSASTFLSLKRGNKVKEMLGIKNFAEE